MVSKTFIFVRRESCLHSVVKTFSLGNKDAVPCQEAAVGHNAGRTVSTVGGMLASAMEKTWPSVFLLNG